MRKRKKINLQDIRRATLEFYFRCFLIVVAVAVALFLTTRVGRPLISWSSRLVGEGVPQAASAVRNDWLLIPAFLLVVILLWSIPWEALLENNTAADPNYRRGRRLQGQAAAMDCAYDDLFRQRSHRRATMRRKQKPSPTQTPPQVRKARRPKSGKTSLWRALCRFFFGSPPGKRSRRR